jgi:protein subunit release factor B
MHLTKKDFRIEWYSGSGAGGQHRNKHQNCCRIIHIESGIKSHGTSSRERSTNQRDAFENLAAKLVRFATMKVRPRINTSVIRNYNASRNEVHDKVSGLKMPYSVVMGDIGPMIDVRRLYMQRV